MKNKRLVIGLCAVALIIGVFGFKYQTSSPKAQASKKEAQSIPEYEVYRQLFHHHVTMKKKAEELEKQGKDGKFLREFYRQQAKLNDDQARALDQIASSCEDEIVRQDAKAKAIIDAALAKNGNGKLSKGAKPPDTPSELRSLWDERNAIIIRHKYGLQAALGDSEFKRFEDYVKKDVVPRIEAAPNRPSPTPRGPKHGPRVISGPSPTPEGR